MFCCVFFFKQKTAYEMRISDWSSDVCSSDLEQEARALLDLPTEMRNRIALLSIEGETTAGATVLLDERWRRRPVGLVIAGTDQQTQPLLSESYYLESALQPFTELRKGTVDELLQRQIAVLALPDSVVLSAEERSRIAAWENGRAHV